MKIVVHVTNFKRRFLQSNYRNYKHGHNFLEKNIHYQIQNYMINFNNLRNCND
ncbi:hypothetical protein HanIR_Chr15g0753171 [Helianthus annuus]|nr:hypothetical protein HanIR_Chr15g0753171 [Helianthus annuus]